MGSSDESRLGVEINLQTGALPLDLLGGVKCPSVGLLFFAWVIGNNTASVGVGKQSACGFACLVTGKDSWGKEKGLKSSRTSATSSRRTLLLVVDHNGIHGFVLHVRPLHVDGDGLAA